MSKTYYKKGFKYLAFSEEDSLFKFAVFLHKNKNGSHFDIRLASYSNPDTVYSWSSKKNPLDKNYPVPIRRVKDHPKEAISLDTMNKVSNLKVNKYISLEEDKAELTEIDKKAGLTFETETRTFKILPCKGKKYYFHTID